MFGQRTGGVAPRFHFYGIKLALIAQLSKSAVKPFGSFPQAKLFGSQAPPDPLHQRSVLFLTVRDPEVVGKASMDCPSTPGLPATLGKTRKATRFQVAM
jgi:hypothetical protein